MDTALCIQIILLGITAALLIIDFSYRNNLDKIKDVYLTMGYDKAVDDMLHNGFYIGDDGEKHYVSFMRVYK